MTSLYHGPPACQVTGTSDAPMSESHAPSPGGTWILERGNPKWQRHVMADPTECARAWGKGSQKPCIYTRAGEQPHEAGSPWVDQLSVETESAVNQNSGVKDGRCQRCLLPVACYGQSDGVVRTSPKEPNYADLQLNEFYHRQV